MSMTSKHRFVRSRTLWVLAAILGVAILASALPPASSYVGSPQRVAWVVGL
jgi:hypothetical protein